jgi:hypothetical protein
VGEVKERAITYRVSYRCDVCKRGFMYYLGWSSDVLPDRNTTSSSVYQYTHRCDRCDEVAVLARRYPTQEIEYREEKDTT